MYFKKTLFYRKVTFKFWQEIKLAIFLKFEHFILECLLLNIKNTLENLHFKLVNMLVKFLKEWPFFPNKMLSKNRPEFPWKICKDRNADDKYIRMSY